MKMVKKRRLSHEQKKKSALLEKLKQDTTCAVPYCLEKKCMHSMLPGYVMNDETKEVHQYGVQVSLGEDGKVNGSGEVTYPIPLCIKHMIFFNHGVFCVRVDKDGTNARLQGDFNLVALIETVALGVAEHTFMQLNKEKEDHDKEQTDKSG